MSALGQKRTNHLAPKSSNLRCYSNSGQTLVRLRCPLCANNGHSAVHSIRLIGPSEQRRWHLDA
jgi:hypothetical protein